MTDIKRMLNDPKIFGAAVFLLSVLAICAAWFCQLVLQLIPCTLCYLERDPWYLMIPVGAALFFLPRRGALTYFLDFVTLVAFIVELGLNVLHWGVEERWWQSPFSSCHSNASLEGVARDVMASLPLAPVKPCDAADFIFGIPISLSHLCAFYSVGAFFVLLLLWINVRIRSHSEH